MKQNRDDIIDGAELATALERAGRADVATNLRAETARGASVFTSAGALRYMSDAGLSGAEIDRAAALLREPSADLGAVAPGGAHARERRWGDTNRAWAQGE
jgi:hypothetical protein